MSSRGGDGACVYQIVHRASGKSYIGITSMRAHDRWQHHKTLARTGRGACLHAALRKYGFDAFDWRVVAGLPNLKLAQIAERQLIRQGLGHYNVTAGGEGTYGMRHAPETRKRMSDSAKARGQQPPPGVGAAAAVKVHTGAKRPTAWCAAIQKGLRKRHQSDDAQIALRRDAANREAQQRYYRENRDSILAALQAAYVPHPRPRKTEAERRECNRQRMAAWRVANPEKTAANQATANANRKERRRRAHG